MQNQFLLSPFNPFIATISVKMWRKKSRSYPLFLCPFPRLIRLYKVRDSALKLRRFPEAPRGSGEADWQQAANTGSPGAALCRPGNKTPLIWITARHRPANQPHLITAIQDEQRKRRGYHRESQGTVKYGKEDMHQRGRLTQRGFTWALNSSPQFHKLPGVNDVSTAFE